MRVRLFVLLLAFLPAIAQTQTALPPDINPVTLSRLPPVSPEDLDEEGRKLAAAAAGGQAGPRTHARHELQPQGAQPRRPHRRGQPGRPPLLSARGAHHGERNRSAVRVVRPRAGGLEAGLEPSVIDVVKHNKDVASLSDKDATLITFGRTLYREHKVSSELWQKMVGHFGRQQTVQLMMIMGDYFRVRLHDERRRSAPAAGSEATAAPLEPMTSARGGLASGLTRRAGAARSLSGSAAAPRRESRSSGNPPAIGPA